MKPKSLFLSAGVILAFALGILPANAADLAYQLRPIDQRDVPVYDQATVSQAHLIVQTAATYAARNGGRYPTRVEQLQPLLPQGQALPNVWTGSRSVPSDERAQQRGEISYRVIFSKGQPVGCKVFAVGSDRSYFRLASSQEL